MGLLNKRTKDGTPTEAAVAAVCIGGVLSGSFNRFVSWETLSVV